MWICCPFFNGDAHLAKALVSWVKQVDGNLSHGALLVSDPGVDWGIAAECLQIASSTFQRVEITTSEEATEGWVVGANTLFKTAAQWFQDRNIGPWLWLEPDAVPLKKGWLDTIQAAYFAAGKPFFGSVMQATEPNMPKDYLAGIACYPADAWKRMSLAWDESMAFDVATASVTVPFAANTELIQHFWGQKDLPPTFVAEKTSESPVNAFTLAKIGPEAVIFHRNKDGSLLRLLGCRQPSIAALVPVFPFCWMDSNLMLEHLRWLHRLHGKVDRPAVLSTDFTVPNSILGQILTLAKAVFSDVGMCQYRNSKMSGWPSACNWAFQSTAKYMAANGQSSWIWMEADAVAITADWMDRLDGEYCAGGKPFMGTIIGAFDGWHGGHMNGVGVYPPNIGEYSNSILTCTRQAWDTAFHDEVGKQRLTELCHKANHLIQHCGAVVNGKCKPANGPTPSFGSRHDVDSILERTSVIFHPCKDGSLIRQLWNQ